MGRILDYISEEDYDAWREQEAERRRQEAAREVERRRAPRPDTTLMGPPQPPVLGPPTPQGYYGPQQPMGPPVPEEPPTPQMPPEPTPWQQVFRNPTDYTDNYRDQLQAFSQQSQGTPVLPPEGQQRQLIQVPEMPDWLTQIPERIRQGDESLRRQQPGYRVAGDVWGRTVGPVLGKQMDIVGKEAELLGGAMEGYGKNMPAPLTEIVQSGLQGERWAPRTWQELQQAQEKRPERGPLDKMIRQGIVDPLNIVPLPLEKLPGLARAATQAARPSLRAAREAMPDVGQAARGLGRTLADETGAIGKPNPLIAKAKKEFGTTYDPREAGYLTPDGEFLDFSGKRQGGSSGVRYQDHREINAIMDNSVPDESNSMGMHRFMTQTGSVRWSLIGGRGGDLMIDIAAPPTPTQIQRILRQADISSTKGSTIWLDITDPKTGRTLSSEEIPASNVRELRRLLNEAKLKLTESMPSEGGFALPQGVGVEAAGGFVGAAAGYDPNATPEENARRMAMGGIAGAGLGYGAKKGLMGLSVEDVSKGKVSAKTGFTKGQEQFLANEVKKVAPSLPESFTKEQTALLAARFEQRVPSDIITPEQYDKWLAEKPPAPTLPADMPKASIAVPGDGTVTVYTQEQANNLHKLLTGKAIGEEDAVKPIVPKAVLRGKPYTTPAEFAEYTQPHEVKAAVSKTLGKDDFVKVRSATLDGDPAWSNGFMLDKGELPGGRPFTTDNPAGDGRRFIVNGPGQKAIPLGYLGEVGERATSGQVVLGLPGGKLMAVEDRYLGYFMRKYGNPDFIVRRPGAPIEVQVNGEVVGLVMPMTLRPAEMGNKFSKWIKDAPDIQWPEPTKSIVPEAAAPAPEVAPPASATPQPEAAIPAPSPAPSAIPLSALPTERILQTPDGQPIARLRQLSDQGRGMGTYEVIEWLGGDVPGPYGPKGQTYRQYFEERVTPRLLDRYGDVSHEGADKGYLQLMGGDQKYLSSAAAPPAPGPAAGKQAWEMGYQEFQAQRSKQPTKRSSGAGIAAEYELSPGQRLSIISSGKKSGWWRIEIDGVEYVGKDPRSTLGIAHKRIVASALSKGKPVPEAVLKDYPDLAAKAKALAPEPVVQAVGQTETLGKVVRFAAGKQLKPDERKEVLRSIVDVYKANKLEKVSKGINKYGEEVMGYPYAPEHFLKSDITGKPIRFFIKLPDGKIAHPSELFPSITDSAIKRHIEDELIAAKNEALANAENTRIKNSRIAEPNTTEDINLNAKTIANRNYTRTGRPMPDSYFAQDEQGRVVRVDGSDPKDVQYFESHGFRPITKSVAELRAERAVKADAPEPVVGAAPEPVRPPEDAAAALDAQAQAAGGAGDDVLADALDRLKTAPPAAEPPSIPPAAATPPPAGAVVPPVSAAPSPAPAGGPAVPPAATPGGTTPGSVIDAKLPDDLSKAKPRYKSQQLNFESDVDRALYIVAKTDPRSKRDADYMAFLREQFPDRVDAELRRMGGYVRSAVGKKAGSTPSEQVAILHKDVSSHLAALQKKAAPPAAIAKAGDVPGMATTPPRGRKPLWADWGAPTGEEVYPKPSPTGELPTATPSGRVPGGPGRMTPLPPRTDPMDLLRDALTPDRRTPKEVWDDTSGAVMRATYDRQWNLGGLEDALRRHGFEVPVHQLAQVVSGSIAAGEDRIRRFVLPVLKPLGRDVTHLEAYMVNMRNKDILARNPDARLANEIPGWAGINAIEASLRRELGPARFAHVEAAAQEMWRINRELILQPLVDEGMMTRDALRDLTSAHPHYIDFHRGDFSVTDTIAKVMGRPEASVSDLGLRKMEMGGSVRKYDNPLVRTEAQIIRTAQLVSRNRAAKAIVQALTERERITGESLVTLLTPNQAAEHSRLTDTISFFHEGQKVVAQVPPVYATIAKGLEAETSNFWSTVARWTSAPLRGGAVTYNPLFLPTNAIRDAWSAFYREGLIPLSPEYWRGWIAALTKNSDYTDAAEAGALMSGILDNFQSTEAMSRASRMGELQVDNAWDAIAFLPRLVKAANKASEEATRVATYHKLRGQGVRQLEAAIRTRDVSVDFAKAGTATKVINQAIPFLNAGIQGASNTVRLMKDNPKQAIMASTVLAVPSLLAFLNNQRFETAKSIPDYDYAQYWVFVIAEGTRSPDPKFPNAPGEKFPVYVKVPKGPLGAFVTAPIEMGIRMAWAKDDRSIVENLLKGAGQAARAISPIEPNLSGIIPAAASPLIGMATNKDIYTDRPIVPRREQDRPPELQYGPETSRQAVVVGEKFGVSPRMIDWAIKDYTAGIGQQATWAIDLAMGALGVDPLLPGQAKFRSLTEAEELLQNPFVRRFVGSSSSAEESRGWAAFDDAYMASQRAFAQVPQLRSLGVMPGQVSDAVSIGRLKIPLLPQERAELQRSSTTYMLELSRPILSDPTFSTLPVDLQKRLLSRPFETGRDQARLEFLGKLPKDELERRMLEAMPVRP